MPSTPSPNSPPLLSRHHKRAIAFSLLVAAGFYLTIALYTGYDKVLSALSHTTTSLWLILLCGSFCNYLVRYLRWRYYLGLMGHHLPDRLHFIYYLAGFALTTTPGKAGEVIRSVLLRPHGIKYSQSIAAFFTERLLDVLVIALLASFTLIFINGQRGFTIAADVFVIGVILLLRQQRIQAKLRLILKRWRTVRLRKLAWHLLIMLNKARRLLAMRSLLLGNILGITAWVIQGMAFTFLLSHFDINLHYTQGFGIYAMSLLIGAASFLPGGVGSTELAMYILLKAVGVDDVSALTIPLISRLSTLWFAVSLGLLSTLYLSFRRDSVSYPA